ncbi:hypothetical protein FH966_14200 [Lentibacillus cibarius]|uniref:DUF3679 domain-containing protein n=1 Tax=Lentibacillus cibarius TaxID=2583219 RepID=A0A549YLK8_9BACI|nr:hypothetical protein [Lentibacillus cibarius]TRM12756.1 hypothetical protein FH966_14200 [Lentibacillus cibarius]
MRSLVVLLLLALFFLTGMVVGMDRDGQRVTDMNNDDEQTESAAEQSKPDDKIKITTESTPAPDETVMKSGTSEHFIQKAASFLEAGVNGAYELVVRVAYQFAQVFF